MHLLILLVFLLPSDSVTLYLVSHGWHTGIILPEKPIPPHQWDIRKDFPGARYFEIGWGDAAFYQAPEPNGYLALRAVLYPTPAVLHVVGFTSSPRAFFPCAPMLSIRLPKSQFLQMLSAIEQSFARNSSGELIRLQPGLYAKSYFYASRDTYHLFQTCNVWVARILKQGGLNLTPWYALTVSLLWKQVQPFSTPVPPAPECKKS